MCGISAIFGTSWTDDELKAMVAIQRHRGPDAEGTFVDAAHIGGIGHNRLSIIDLSEAGRQPLFDSTGRYAIVLNGEIYNYLELRGELAGEFSFRTRTDTEVLLAAYLRWGTNCLDKLIGMFAFVIYDLREMRAFAARDRFGVKPLYYHHRSDGTLLIASEIKALHAAGIERAADEISWAEYFAHGLYDHSDRTFWRGINSLKAGHFIIWDRNITEIRRWYDLAERIGDSEDDRSESEVKEELLSLLKSSTAFRFRSDVPIGICLSGGLDSSTLLGLVHEVQGHDAATRAFTFVTGNAEYDELPWVRQMLEHTRHPLEEVLLRSGEVPELADSVSYHQDEPFGGLPTLAYAKLFETARGLGTIVLLDGNGMDEQWCGYDYYRQALEGSEPGVVQGTRESVTAAECLLPDFRKLAGEAVISAGSGPFNDRIRNVQFRDAFVTKLPRALRFNDRVSMRASTELREPFLDHRLFELAVRQPTDRKIMNGTHKRLLREAVAPILPKSVSEMPKRPLQTPQREWLRAELRDWAASQIDIAVREFGGRWIDTKRVRSAWEHFCSGRGDNSFFVWQWISLGLLHRTASKAAVDHR